MTRPKRYDRAYFDRWYRDPRHRVTSPAALARKVAMVVGVVEYELGRRLASVLDVGCGEAPWRAPLKKLRPGVHYLGVDPSPYVEARFGRTRDVRRGALGALHLVDGLADEAPFDLVVCADVLQYLSDDEVAAGLAELREHLGGVAYVEAYTALDALEGDRRDWHERSADDYLRLFRGAGLVHCGLHCYVGARVSKTMTELERGRA